MPRKRKPEGRREKGEGSYRWDEKNQRHIWRITVEGKRYEVADRQADRAKARFAALKAQLTKGIDVSSAKQTLNTYLPNYLDTVVVNEVSNITLRDYKKRAGHYLLPTLGDYALGDLTTPLIQAWVNAMVKKGWAQSSIKQIRSLLERCLERAVTEHILTSNPAAGVKAPKVRTVLSADDEESDRTLTADEVQKLLAAVADTPYELLYTLAARYGLRRGELLGLRWKDVDTTQNLIRIRQQVRQLDNVIEITSELKTAASRRIIPFKRDVLPLLAAQRARVAKRRLKLGADWLDLDLVFPNPDGNRRRPDNLTTHFDRIMTRLKFGDHHLHDLRATAITHMRDCGIDAEIIAAIVGHNDIQVTLKVYSETTEKRMREAIERTA